MYFSTPFSFLDSDVAVSSNIDQTNIRNRSQGRGVPLFIDMNFFSNEFHLFRVNFFDIIENGQYKKDKAILLTYMAGRRTFNNSTDLL